MAPMGPTRGEICRAFRVTLKPQGEHSKEPTTTRSFVINEQGGGGSKKTTANHRRPLPFRIRVCGHAIEPCAPPAVVETLRGT
eukprot:6581647-Pyramimonas_sp.AAC.1